MIEKIFGVSEGLNSVETPQSNSPSYPPLEVSEGLNSVETLYSSVAHARTHA